MATPSFESVDFAERLPFRSKVRKGEVVAFDATTLQRYYVEFQARMKAAQAGLDMEGGRNHDIYLGQTQAFHDSAVLFANLCAYHGTPTEDNRPSAPVVGERLAEEENPL